VAKSKTKEESIIVLDQVQEAHRKASSSLLDACSAQISKMFEQVALMSDTEGLILDNMRKQLRLLVKTFVSLAQSAQVQGFYL